MTKKLDRKKIPCEICGHLINEDGTGTPGHKRSKKHLAALTPDNQEKPEQIKTIPAKVESVKIPEIPVRQEPVIIHETKPLETKPDEPTKQKSEKEEKDDTEWDGYYC